MFVFNYLKTNLGYDLIFNQYVYNFHSFTGCYCYFSKQFIRVVRSPPTSVVYQRTQVMPPPPNPWTSSLSSSSLTVLFPSYSLGQGVGRGVLSVQLHPPASAASRWYIWSHGKGGSVKQPPLCSNWVEPVIFVCYGVSLVYHRGMLDNR